MLTTAGCLRSSQRRCSVIKGVLRNFAEITWRKTTTGLHFIKKETPTQVFSCEFCEFFKNTFFTEHLRKTASVAYNLRCLRLLSRVLALVITQIFNFWFLIFISVREFSADHKWENSSCILWEVIDSIFSFASFVHQLKRNEMEHFQKIFQEQLSSVTYFCLTQRSFEYRVFSFDYLQEHFKWN